VTILTEYADFLAGNLPLPPMPAPPDPFDGRQYLEFLQSKFKFSHDVGFEVNPADVNPLCMPHQRDMIVWGVRKGRAAWFASFGLGKTWISLEAMRLILERHGGRALIVMPLGVRMEFRAAAATLGIEVTFVKSSAQVDAPGIYLTNYESVRDGKLDVNLFVAISLDEAAVLRSYGSKTYQSFLAIFADVQFRFVATATPSPNNHKELIHYAGFLGIMDTGQALTRFFQRDSEKANNLTLYPHMVREFHLWLHSWAAFVQAPSDLGYDNTGYTMPDLIVRTHEVLADDISGGVERDGQSIMFRDGAVGLKEAAKEKRDSIDARIAKMLEIVHAAPCDHFIIWHDLEAERHAIMKALPVATEVYGSLDLEEREDRTADFANGEVQYLATKPIVSGVGANLQRHCHREIFLGIGYKFHDFMQAIHRVQRYGQPYQVEIDIIYCETEREIWRDLQRKWQEHEALTERMSDLISEHGLSTLSLEGELARTIGVTRIDEVSALYTAVHNDSVLECNSMAENSVDQIITSIPFGNHYEYCTTYNDFGHNDNNRRFFQQMDFLTPNLLRILKPGRVACVHVKDRINFGNVTGFGMPTVEPFHVDCVKHYIHHGFAYMGMITVVTDVVRENNQTYRLGWSENAKDGTKMGVGGPEYILLFRKLPSDTSTAYADVPVTKPKAEYTRGRWQIDAHAFWRSSGDRFLTFDELAGYGPDMLARVFPKKTLETIYDYQAHVAVANVLDIKHMLPASFMAVAPGSHNEDVWHDVNRMRTLNGVQSSRNLTMHVCPLQLDIVNRLLERFSAPGDMIFDPFAGLMTVPFCAIKARRRGIGVELSPDYYLDGLRYLREAERDVSMPTLFAMEGL
jgi:DNA methylase